jgi:Cu2+-exporting ATPase
VSDSLSRLLPAAAHRITRTDAGESIADVAVSQLRGGDVLLVRAGEVVPADGEILDACTRIDESMLTGESLPVARRPGERAAAGTINVDAPFRLQVSAVGASTILAGIVALLNRAQSERPRVTREADRTASRFLARVLIVAAVVCAVWLAVDPSRAFNATLAVLVVACPCALSLATLVAVASANAALARRGVLVTHADAIEGLAKVDRVVFDKTGTLTTGDVSISGIRVLRDTSSEHCLQIAAALEAASEHPIARAFSAAAAGNRLAVSDVQVSPGEGIDGVIDGHRYRIGTARFAARDAGPGQGNRLEDEAGIVLGDGQGALALFSLSDAPRPESRHAVAALQSQGLAIEILSGDAPAAVARVAEACGIKTFAARQSPTDKLEHVRRLTADGGFAAMVGDGLNDAPVLGGSGVSIAMSRGSALTLASADIILVGDSLRALPGAFVLARRARGVIKQNLIWAAGYNLTAMPLAALGWVPPWVAAIGMSLSSIVVVLNSLRLMRETPEPRNIQPPLSAALPRGTG